MTIFQQQDPDRAGPGLHGDGPDRAGPSLRSFKMGWAGAGVNDDGPGLRNLARAQLLTRELGVGRED